MRAFLLTASVLSMLLLGAGAALADALPECPPGQVMDCTPTQHSHGCGGCIDDPDAPAPAPSGGCATTRGAASANAWLGLSLLLGSVVLGRRRR